MFYVEANANTARPVGSHAVERMIAANRVRNIARIEGPDSIGCYAITFDNGDYLDVSRTESTAEGFPLINRANIKAWLIHAIATAHKVAQTSATIADEGQDIASLAA